MKKIIFASLLTLSSLTAFAGPNQFNCKATYNLDTVFETEVQLAKGERNKSIGGFESFQFFLSDNGNSIVELQSLNSMDPSRSYATAKISEAGSFVELAIWTRDYLLEVRCTR